MKPMVIGLGNCTADYLALVPTYPLLDERMEISQLEIQGGGEVSTAMIALSRLGISTAFIGKIGDDDLGVFIRGEFDREAVNTSHLIIEKNVKSLFAFCVVDESSGKRTIFWHRETSPLKPGELDKDFITSVHILHLDEYEPVAALTAARWAREAGIKVVLDIDNYSTEIEALIKTTDIVIGSKSLVRYFDSRDYFQVAEELSLLGPDFVVITLGEKGCYCKSNDGSFIQPGFRVEVVDTTGAGDAFHGAFIYGILRKWSFEQIADFSNAVAAINCTKLGGCSGLPDLKEVKEFISQQKIKITDNNVID